MEFHKDRTEKESNFLVDPNEVLRFQIERNVTNLYKSFLVILETIEDEHANSLNLLHEKLPDNLKVYVELADYLTESKVNRLRKGVLDAGNDCRRELTDLIKSFNITLK